MSELKLNPCPKCGGGARYFQSGARPYGEEMMDDVGVKCSSCDFKVSSPDWPGAEVEFRKYANAEDWNNM